MLASGVQPRGLLGRRERFGGQALSTIDARQPKRGIGRFGIGRQGLFQHGARFSEILLPDANDAQQHQSLGVVWRIGQDLANQRFGFAGSALRVRADGALKDAGAQRPTIETLASSSETVMNGRPSLTLGVSQPSASIPSRASRAPRKAL